MSSFANKVCSSIDTIVDKKITEKENVNLSRRSVQSKYSYYVCDKCEGVNAFEKNTVLKDNVILVCDFCLEELEKY